MSGKNPASSCGSLTNIKTDQSNEDHTEDAHIAWLEAKLGITKGKSSKKPMSFGDGLDGTSVFADWFIVSEFHVA